MVRGVRFEYTSAQKQWITSAIASPPPWRASPGWKQISDLDDDIVEAMWLELNLLQTKHILLGTVYRPSDSKAEYLSRIDSLFQ